MESHYAEWEGIQEIQIIFQDPDGRTTVRLQGAFVFPEALPGEPLSSRQVLELRDLPLFTPGIHLFSIIVNNTLLRQVKLSVVLAAGEDSVPMNAVG